MADCTLHLIVIPGKIEQTEILVIGPHCKFLGSSMSEVANSTLRSNTVPLHREMGQVNL